MPDYDASRFDQIPGYELVYNAPSETAVLRNDDLRTTAVVWRQMIAEAHGRIDVGQFYVFDRPGSELDAVLRQLEVAGESGVKIRFLVEEIIVQRHEYDGVLRRLRAIRNMELRVLSYRRLTGGGIMHAKYLVVDGAQAYVGSANFDWRALEHIQETGLRISDPAVVEQISAIFELDWKAQELIANGRPVPVQPTTPPLDTLPVFGNYLVASPRAYNPPGVRDSQQALPLLLATARTRIRVQVMEYAPLSFDRLTYYALMDNALRAAATRGVRVDLMVADWSTGQPQIAYLKSLAVLPNVRVRVVTIPRAAGGFVPHARVVHSKIMTVDGTCAWVGTSNWTGGYMDRSRNLELVLNGPVMAGRVDRLYEQLWHSPYARPLRVDHDYPAPHPEGATAELV